MFVLFDIDGIFEIVFSPGRFLLDFYGTLHEWKFRVTLDHYQTWFGCCCAIMMPYLIQAIKKAEGEVTLGKICFFNQDWTNHQNKESKTGLQY